MKSQGYAVIPKLNIKNKMSITVEEYAIITWVQLVSIDLKKVAIMSASSLLGNFKHIQQWPEEIGYMR